MTHQTADTISEAVLESEDFIAIHIGDEKSRKTVSDDTIRTKNSEVWFFQVADVAELKEAPLRLFDSSGNARGPVASGSGIDYNQLFDSAGDDVLRNDEEDFTLYHFSVGVKQDDLRVYPRIPDNQNGGGFTYLTGDEPDPTVPSPTGWIPSSATDFEDPSTRLETVVWREGVRSTHQYGFYNDSEVQLDPILSLVGAAYNLRPVLEESQKLNLLADMGRPKSEQENVVRTVEFSRATLRSFSFDVPSDWKDVENNLSVDSAQLPEDINRRAEQGSGGGN